LGGVQVPGTLSSANLLCLCLLDGRRSGRLRSLLASIEARRKGGRVGCSSSQPPGRAVSPFGNLRLPERRRQLVEPEVCSAWGRRRPASA